MTADQDVRLAGVHPSRAICASWSPVAAHRLARPGGGAGRGGGVRGARLRGCLPARLRPVAAQLLPMTGVYLAGRVLQVRT
jgi:hypothetical protein